MASPPPLEDVQSPAEAPKLIGSKSAGWLPSIRPLSGVTHLRVAQTKLLSVPQGAVSPTSTQTPFTTTLEDWTFSDGWGTSSRAFLQASTRPQSNAGLRKSKSDGALHGLSPKASKENARAGSDLFSLGKQKKAGAGAASSGKTKAEFIDQAKLVKDFDKLTSALGEVKNMFEGFDPRRTAKQLTLSDLLAGAQGQKEDSGAGEDGDAEEALREAKERLAERLQAYKFARRIEPEMPPLAPLPPSGLSPRKAPLQTLVVRNTSQEAIRVWLPHNRKARISNFAEDRDNRRQMYQSQRIRIIEESACLLQEDLERKERQASNAVEARKLQAKLRTESRDFPAAKWFALIWAAGFLRQIQQDQKQRKVPVLERVQYFEEHQESLLVKRSKLTAPQMKEAIRMENVVQSPAVSRLFTSYVASIRMRRKIIMAKLNAKKVYQAMRSWQVAGRVIFALKNVAFQARKLQRFWRQCSARLHDQREKISQRWERLERQELTQEFSKWERPPPVGRRGSTASLSMEDKVNMEMVSKAERMTFLENELRARRYFLLPAIANWERECQRWHEDYNQRLEHKRAFQALGQEFEESAEHAFSFPPSRPMHLPPAHPVGEATRGAVCSIGCPGRRGDEEILDMWRRCRQDPLSWKPVPRAGIKEFAAKKEKKIAPAEESPKFTSLDALLDNDKDQFFGDAPDAEARAFGVDAALMPGGEPPAEDEALPVTLPC